MSLYFDYNATFPVSADLIARVAEKTSGIGNPSAVHGYGRKARQLIEDTRFKLADVVNCTGEQITFTSGGTEANNMAFCMVDQILDEKATILVSKIEHPAVLKTAQKVFGDRVSWIPVNPDGVIDLEFVEEKLKASDGKSFISVMYANNETGVVQPIEKLVEIAGKYDALVHSDAVQALGKIPVDFKAMGVDLMSISGHKIGAFPGVGALMMRKNLDAYPLICGGGQEKGRRAGTENAIGIYSLGLKLQELPDELTEMAKIAKLRDALEVKMKAADESLVVLGENAPRLPNTSMVVSKAARGDVLVITLDLEGIAISAGSACSSGKTKASHVLEAMSVSEELASGAIRISLGPDTTEADINTFFEAWKKNAVRSHPELVSGSHKNLKKDAEINSA